ncbi:acyltransferase family protein [Fretibacter rubidus]|uniref:acyltransferase family protein n=1 Tax=Fretibacter rubidus TaxID=570162 RepID=UPI00352B2B4C
MFQWVKINDGHDNFFTPLRLLFAVMVVIGHAYVIALGDQQAEFNLFFGYKPSYLAVNLFFIASGFLVTKSMLYRRDVAEYSSARILRIYPALFIHVLFVMFVMGPFVTSLPLKQFFTDPQFYTQPLQVLSFYQAQMTLPGALETNAEQLGSAPLWTLRYEILAYIGTVTAFALGLMKHRWMIGAQFLVFAAAWPLAHISGLYDMLPGTGQNMLRFGICYGLGAAVYAYREHLKFNIIGVIIMGAIAALTHKTLIFEVTTAMFLGYFVFWAAYVKAPKLDGLKHLSDTSYGIYIYHWCIMQWLFYTMPTLSPLALIAIALPITIALAYASWIFIEKPMLTRKTRFAETLRFRRKKNHSPRRIGCKLPSKYG